MTPELEKALERQRQQRQARRETVQQGTAANRAPVRTLSGAHAAGDRVFDTVTGQEGIVLYGTSENIIVSTPER